MIVKGVGNLKSKAKLYQSVHIKGLHIGPPLSILYAGLWRNGDENVRLCYIKK